MRPVGSTNGRIPEGGYPEVSPEMGAFLAGFIEGEGCFGIVKATRGYGYKPHFSMVARDDDRHLIHCLHAATNIGRIQHKPRSHTSNPQVSWRVSAKGDCRRLVELLYASPLRGRKARAYAPWRAAVQRWVGDDATKRLTRTDWIQFPGWKEAIEQANRFHASTGLHGFNDPPWNGWESFLAGFITAEGHFAVSQEGSPRFALRLRADDLPLLQRLKSAASVGRIYGPYEGSGNGASPVVAWQVFSTVDALKLVDLLELWTPGGRKGLEFHMWKHAVFERAGGGLVWDRARVSLIRERLMGLRRYRGDITEPIEHSIRA